MEDFNWDLFESDQVEFDQRMQRAAFENTYLILTGKVTYESLLEKQSMQPGSIDGYVKTAVLFNPMSADYDPKFPHLHNSESKIDLVDSMVDYYIETEEYEKCAKLVKLKNKLC